MTDRPADTLWGHPKGLYICFLTELWERFSFYGMKALLFFYVTKYHLFGDTEGYLLLGTYGGLAYAMPVLGGLVADRWLGLRKSVTLGAILLCLGHFGMAYEGQAAQMIDGLRVQDAAALQVFYLSLALIITGVGLLKPNISTLVGRLYAAADPRRDAGFTWFYMGINVGAFSAALVCGYLGETLGWGYGFGAAGIGMALGLVTFLWGQRYFGDAAEPARPALLTRKVRGLAFEHWITLMALMAAIGIWQLLQAKLTVLDQLSLSATEAVALSATALLGVWWTRFLLRDCSAAERGRMIVLMVLIAVSTVFWGLYEQSYGSWNAFADRAMNRSALGVDWTAGQLSALGALFILLLSPVFAWLWPWLDRRGWNPSDPLKFALALLCAGASMGVLALFSATPQENGRAAIWGLVLAYFIIEVGEMLLSPIGLAAVTRLSVARVAGLMMGVWFLASAFGEMLAGRLGTLAAMEDLDRGDLEAVLARFQDAFLDYMWIGLISGLLLLLFVPWLQRLTRASAARSAARD